MGKTEAKKDPKKFVGLEICTIGGFSECGRNCVAIRVDDEVIVIDLGLELESYIRNTQGDRDDLVAREYSELVKVNAVPNIDHIKDWHFLIKAIIPSHGHLDHVGAIPFIAPMFPHVPIVSTPYTIEVIREICRGERLELPNQLIAKELNGVYEVSSKIKVEFVEVTHSIPHSAILRVITPYGTVVYGNDYKLDHTPTLGKPIDVERLRAIGNEGVDVFLCESLYAGVDEHTLSELDAKKMLEDELLHGSDLSDKGIIVTTFSSQIARLQALVEIGHKMGRQVVFIGRSLRKYSIAAQRIRLVDFPKSIPFVARRPLVQNMLERIQREGPSKYLIICTGHQGEPNAQLSRMARGETGLRLDSSWHVLFSCSVIPVPLNMKQRAELEGLLASKHVNVKVDLHASGHASGKDHLEMFSYLRPKQIIPSHAGAEMAENLVKLAEKSGYVRGKTVHMLSDGDRFVVE